jgi:hypothetical protein
MKKSTYVLITSVLLFLIFIVLAIQLESTTYLYLASIFPIIIVPLLPDIRLNHYINARKDSGQVRLIKLRKAGESTNDLFVIAFAPGYVRWNKTSRLYFNFDEAVTHTALLPEDDIVTMPILKYDLEPHPRKKNWVGISLPQLVQRTSKLSYTTKEINRLVIQMDDLNEVLKLPVKHNASIDGGLQA